MELEVGLMAFIWIIRADYSHNLLSILAEEERRIISGNVDKLFCSPLLFVPRNDIQEDTPQHREVVSAGAR